MYMCTNMTTACLENWVPHRIDLQAHKQRADHVIKFAAVPWARWLGRCPKCCTHSSQRHLFCLSRSAAPHHLLLHGVLRQSAASCLLAVVSKISARSRYMLDSLVVLLMLVVEYTQGLEMK